MINSIYLPKSEDFALAMSIREYMSRENLDWADVPIWRKTVLFVCLAAASYLGAVGHQDIRIFAFNPHTAVPAHGQVHPLYVMHGSLRYVTLQELEAYRESKDRTTLIGIPFVIAFLTLATAKKS